MLKNCHNCKKETEQKVKVFHPEKVNSSFCYECLECGSYNEIKHRCSQCGKTYLCKFQDFELCPDCMMDHHRKLSGIIGTENKLIYNTKIDYNKYLNK